MFSRLTMAGVLALIASLAWSACLGQAVDRPVTLKVTLDYKGSGIVDAAHRLVVFVYDTDNIGHQATPDPLLTAATEKNGGVLNFSSVKSPVYIIAYYDKAGAYKPDLKELPSGVPAALHGANPAAADPVELKAGRVAEVKITIDDSIVLP